MNTPKPIPGDELMRLLRIRYDEVFNVPVVVPQGKEYLFVHFFSANAHTGIALCSAWRMMEATTQELLNGLVYNNGALCKRVEIRMLENHPPVVVTGLSEKRHYRDKLGEHDAIILEVQPLESEV
jgi:hypothetical protein